MTRVQADLVEEVVCARFQLPRHKLLGQETHRAVSYPRALLMYTLRHNGYRVGEIGQRLQRNHGTVCAGIRSVEARLKTDRETREHVSAIIARLPTRIVFSDGVSF